MLSMPLAPLGSTPRRRYDSPAPRRVTFDTPTPALPQLRDAEQSVDYLCQKFEELTEQLHREEEARAAEERRGQHLEMEVQGVQVATGRRADAVAVLRSNVASAGARAALQASRIREQQKAGALAEQACTRMSEECRQESQSCDRVLQRLATEDRESVRSTCEADEAGRRLKQTEADMQVVKEDLRIESQRKLIVQNELHGLETSLEATSRSWWQSHQDSNQQAHVLGERQQQVAHLEDQVRVTSETVVGARSEGIRCGRRLASVEEDCRNFEGRLAMMQQELFAAERSLQSQSVELKAEAEALGAINSELGALEAKRMTDAQDLAATRRCCSEVEAALASTKQQSSKGCSDKELLFRKLEELKAEEEQLLAQASGLRQARRAEDVAFEDVQGELQAAFRRKEALAEDIAVNTKACDTFSQQLRQLRPEIAELDDRSGRLESSLAKRSRELEDKLLHERRIRQDLVGVTEALHDLRNSEMRIEADFKQLHGSY
eukprot:TRINITY_DN30377_c0_g1_i1.p1 TRINITY_DN30377_c0_g1~~TRINITY_DN30377_c0_g1_i1.p1  ORF type:complete len:493 (+),score=134.92 TRINITY_DN30377_c0_g1_i1:43-1521(+)